MHPFVLICAVELEARPLIARIQRLENFIVGRRSAYRGLLADREVVVIPGGMGKTNAAQSLTAVLERHPAAGVVGFGVGGAYLGAGLQPGEVALATAQYYGDEGVAAPEGWMSCEGIGIALLDAGGARYFNRFPVDDAGVLQVMEVLSSAMAGPFVTVSTCSGTARRGTELAERFAAICETMEGAAFAHVAALYGLPYLEVRGISNLVEDRDRSRWRLEEAAEAAASAVASVLETWKPPPRDPTTDGLS